MYNCNTILGNFLLQIKRKVVAKLFLQSIEYTKLFPYAFRINAQTVALLFIGCSRTSPAFWNGSESVRKGFIMFYVYSVCSESKLCILEVYEQFGKCSERILEGFWLFKIKQRYFVLFFEIKIIYTIYAIYS